jgi:hypothetical protein
MNIPSLHGPKALAGFYPGDVIDLLAPTSDDIRFGEIATRLARIRRFSGGTREAYSVAQHCVRVMDSCSRAAQPYALLHDAHKAFTGDALGPFLRALDIMIGKDDQGRSRFMDGLAAVVGPLDRAIHAAAGLDPDVPEAIAVGVAEADAALAGNELEHLIGLDPIRFGMTRLGTSLGAVVWNESRARREWLNALTYTTGIRAD